MKKLVLILTMCIMHFLSYAQEPVFAYDNNQIKSKPQFIEAFNNGNFDNITSHSLQKSYNVSAQNGDKYIVKCFKNAGWENEPGDWHYLEIAYNGQTIYSIDYADGWEYLSPNLYNPQIQISAESETKRSIFREKDKTKRSKKESAQHSKSRNKSFVMTSVSAL